MPIAIVCACGYKSRVKDEYAGKMLECPSCKASNRIPVPARGGGDRAGDDPTESRTAPSSDHAPYRYKMVQIPPTISVREGTATNRLAADYLESVVAEWVAKGWEYYRVDTIGIQVRPGCLAALLGSRPTTMQYYVITFRCRAA